MSDEPDEQPATTGRLLRRGAATIRAMVRLRFGTFVVAVLGASVFAAATVASSWALGRLTDRVIVPRFRDGEVATGTVLAGLGLVVGVGVVKAAGIVVRRIAATMTGAGVSADLRSAVVRHYQAVPYAHHRRNPTGELLARTSTDVDGAIEVLHPLPYSLGVVVIAVLSVAWMVATDPWLALVGLLAFPAMMGANVVYQRVMERPVAAAQAALGSLTAVAHESFDGALVVKALGAEALESERFGRAAERVRGAKVRAARVRATFDALLDAIPTLGTLVLLPVGAWRVEAGAITTGTVVAFVSLFQLLVFPLRVFGYLLGELPRAVVSHDRIQQALAVPVERPSHAIRIDGLAPGAVEVRGLTFSHEPGLEVLRDVSFTIEPGRTVAVVGPTGSGKSTLLLLLAGLLDPDEGEIRLGGSAVAMAFQEPFLFADTVAENVLLGADDVELDRVLALAGAEGFVAALPDGPATVVGERGATLSGGQRQRLALARALARRPRILLLDDATSAVDPTTEGRILAALSSGLAGTTTIVVASRPATIAMADEVLYLEAGRLVAHARHEELLARYPHYRQLVHAYELDRADRDGQRTA